MWFQKFNLRLFFSKWKIKCDFRIFWPALFSLDLPKNKLTSSKQDLKRCLWNKMMIVSTEKNSFFFGIQITHSTRKESNFFKKKNLNFFENEANSRLRLKMMIWTLYSSSPWKKVFAFLPKRFEKNFQTWLWTLSNLNLRQSES